MAEAAGIQVEDLGLFTDLYQLTMAQSYLEHDKNRPATFSLIVRTLSPQPCVPGGRGIDDGAGVPGAGTLFAWCLDVSTADRAV